MPSVLQNNLIYAVYLSYVSLGAGQTAMPRIGTSNTAIVDVHGLIEIAQSSRSLTVTEGNRLSLISQFLLS